MRSASTPLLWMPNDVRNHRYLNAIFSIQLAQPLIFNYRLCDMKIHLLLPNRRIHSGAILFRFSKWKLSQETQMTRVLVGTARRLNIETTTAYFQLPPFWHGNSLVSAETKNTLWNNTFSFLQIKTFSGDINDSNFGRNCKEIKPWTASKI